MAVWGRSVYVFTLDSVLYQRGAAREGWIPLTEGWVRGHRAAMRSLTVPLSNTGTVWHSSRARTTVLVRCISCHLDSMTLKRKLELDGWHCVTGWQRGPAKTQSGSNVPADCLRQAINDCFLTSCQTVMWRTQQQLEQQTNKGAFMLAMLTTV